MREESGNIDADSYFQWAQNFTEHVKDLTCGNLHLLLAYVREVL